MKRKIVSGLTLTLLVISMLTLAFNIQPVKASATIYIRADGSVDPPTAPILNGGNIYYTFTANIYETIVVQRSNIVLDGAGYTLQGRGPSPVGTGIDLSDRINVTIKNTQITLFAIGINLNYSLGNILSSNTITYCGAGILLRYYSNNNTLIRNNGTYGIQLSESHYNTIENNVAGRIWVYHSSINTLRNNAITELYLLGSDGNTITNNNIDVSFSLSSSHYNTFAGNNITSNKSEGIKLERSDHNIFSGNIITNNGHGDVGSYDGISFWYSSNKLMGNKIINSKVGIRIYYSSCTLIDNNITNNEQYGIVLNDAGGSVIYHNNFIDNAQHVVSWSGGAGAWDDGYPSGGNYWSNYTGVDLFGGPYQNITGSDGIGDTPYVIDADNRDLYPLTSPWMTPPTPDFSITAYPTSLTIQQGDSDTSVITTTSIGGFDQTVQLILDVSEPAPLGATATLSPEQVTPPPDGSTTSTLTVSVGTTATAGSYILTVTGTNGTLTHSVDISLEITATPPPEQVSAKIDSYSISPRNVAVGNDVTIGFSFTNTGNVSWAFGAGATLRKPDGTRIDFLTAVTVNSDGSKSAQWTYTLDMAGRWDIVFGVWRESTHPLENLLVQTSWVDEYITATAIEKQPPVASFTYSPESPFSSGDLVSFNASGSYDPEGGSISYRWNFSDGTTKEGKIVTHRFRGAQNKPKTYTVNLTVEDNNGATDSDTLSVTVNPLKKRAQLKPTYIDVRPFMEVTYNWVGIDEATGEDLYIISQIDTHFGGILGTTQFFIVRRTSPSPSWPKVIWHIPLPTEWRENTQTYTKFDDPSWWQRIWGTPYEPTKLTFPDGTFEGIDVTETSFIVIIATGAEISIISTYWDAGWTRFDPNSPPSSLSQERLKEVEDFKEILDLLDKLLAVIGSPGELRIYDSEGRVTGLVNGEIKEEIPGSAYTNGSIMILYSNGIYRYEVGGIDNGTYKLLVISVENADATTFIATEIPTLSNTVHQYTVDWAALSQGEEGVTLQIDSEGDGTFEKTITSDNELTQDEFMLQVPSAEAFPLWVLGAVAAVVIGVAVAATFLWRRRK